MSVPWISRNGTGAGKHSSTLRTGRGRSRRGRALAGGPRLDVEFRIVRKDGEVRVVRSQGDVMRDVSGRAIRMFGIQQDITELRQAEKDLRASETRFRALVDHASDGFFLHADDSTVIDVNRQACASLGYSREELIGMHPRQFDPGLDRPSLARMTERIATGEAVTFETLHRRKDGSVFPVEVRARQFQHGERRLHVSLVRDITERKRAEEERRTHLWFLESMDRINRAMQATSDLEQMMSDVLEAVLEVFASDRAWLVYPCDPDAPSWRPVMERTRPQFPGVAARGRDLPMTPESAEVARVALASSGALLRGGSHEHQPSAEIAEHFGVRSHMLMALYPKGDRPYLFGLHQCSPRAHVDDGRAAPFRGDRPSAHRRAGEPHRRPRPARKRAPARGGAAACARGLVGARLCDGPRIALRRGVPDFRRAAARVAALARPLAEPHPSRRSGESRGRERPGVARRSALRRRIPGGAARRCRARGAQPGRRDARRVRPPVRQFGVMQDVTELRQTEHRLEAAQHLARVGWWECDHVADRITFSDEVAEIFGIAQRDRSIDHAEWMRLLPTIIHPDDWGRVSEARTPPCAAVLATTWSTAWYMATARCA